MQQKVKRSKILSAFYQTVRSDRWNTIKGAVDQLIRKLVTRLGHMVDMLNFSRSTFVNNQH